VGVQETLVSELIITSLVGRQVALAELAAREVTLQNPALARLVAGVVVDFQTPLC
jgi:hypothetical protein